MLAISTLYGECGGFGGKSGSTDDDARYTDEVRYVGRIEISDRDDGGRRVEKELMLRKAEVVRFL